MVCRIQGHPLSFAIPMSQKRFFLFHPERLRLFAANLMEASLRR